MENYVVNNIKNGQVHSSFGTNTFSESIEQFEKSQKVKPKIGYMYPKKTF